MMHWLLRYAVALGMSVPNHIRVDVAKAVFISANYRSQWDVDPLPSASRSILGSVGHGPPLADQDGRPFLKQAPEKSLLILDWCGRRSCGD